MSAPDDLPALPSESAPFLFIAMDADKRAHLTWCADEAEVRAATLVSMFWMENGEALDDDNTRMLDGVVEELLDSGCMTFEGDAPLYLYRVARAHTPAQATPKQSSGNTGQLTDEEMADCGLLSEIESEAQATGAPADAPDERAVFEAWAEPQGFNIQRDESDKYRDYHRVTTRWAWMAWRARAQAPAAAVPPTGVPSICPHGTPHRWPCDECEGIDAPLVPAGRTTLARCTSCHKYVPNGARMCQCGGFVAPAAAPVVAPQPLTHEQKRAMWVEARVAGAKP